MIIRTLFQVISIALLGTLLVSPASAQGDDSFSIEEITVTAQKRAQSAQDIGIAVSAFDGDSLRDRNIDSAEQLNELIPNVSLQNIAGGGVPIVIVRGVGLQNFRINDSPTTAFYVDEVYQTSVASAEWTMFDLERVEMLKGPQGGLYGRNAIGGAVQIISKTPDFDGNNNGYLKVGYGEYSKSEIEGAASFALSENTAMRVAGRWVQSSDAPYRSVILNSEQGEEDRLAARVLLRYAPSDTVDLLFKVHGGNDDSQLAALRPMGFFANIGTGTGAASGVSLGALTGALCPSVLAGQGSDPADCAAITGATPSDYGIESDIFASASGTAGFQENQWSGASLNAKFEIGDYSLESITAYDSIDYRRFVDFDGTPLEHQHIDYNTEIDSISQEFRLFYDGSDTFNWVIGLNYAKDELDESSVLFGADGILPLFFGGAVFSPQDYAQETDALAIYGHAEKQLNDAWNLVGELRYTDAEKTFAGGSLLGFADGSTAPFVSTSDKTDFQAVSGKIGLEWFASDYVMVYGSISEGFKTGGFFGGFATNVDQLAPFDEETVLAYEVGVKSDLQDGRLRLNGSVFFYDRKDVQQNAADPNSVVAIKRIANIGDVETVGAELDLTWLASEHLTFTLGVGTTDAEVTDSTFVQSSSLPLLPDTSMQGSNIPNYSDLTVNFLGRYDQPVGDNLFMNFQVDGRYQSEMDLSVITNPIEEALFQEPAFSIWNVRAGIESASGSWRVQAFVENVGDEEYRNTVRNDGTFGVYELYGRPRTWGVSYTYSWE
ncbi:MAG: TonB-dependent receptor [Gammaproteobacteria bacterium]|nr:TonB-dependent receptor [Gammaproteobacteria bacterium]